MKSITIELTDNQFERVISFSTKLKGLVSFDSCCEFLFLRGLDFFED